MYDKKQIGKRLVVLREKRDLEREKVGEDTGYSESTIKKAELGENICLNSAVILAEYYGVSLDYLVLGAECDGDEMAIERLLRSVPEEKRKLAVNAVKGVLSAFISAD